MRRSLFLLALVAVIFGCKGKAPPAKEPEREETPPIPMVDEAFVTRALGAETELSNKALVMDLDPRPGIEALVATHSGGMSHQVALVRGNHEVVARTPLGGKILVNANIRHVGAFAVEDGLAGGAKIILLPVETLVYKQNVCGMLAFRYRSEALILVGEFGCRCWRKEAGAARAVDPYSLMRVDRSGAEVRIEMQEEKGSRLYRWHPEELSFVSLALTRKSKRR